MQRLHKPVTRISTTNRSRTTNGGQLLDCIDGRSAIARRFRDIKRGLECEFECNTEAERALIRQAAVLSVLSEQLQAKMVLGELVDARTITNLAVQLRRILADLRQRTGQRDPSPPSLHEQLAAYGTTLDADDEEEIRVYRLAMVDRAGIDRGPLISLMWAGYFFAMWALIWRFYPGYAVLPAVLFAGLGLTGYRMSCTLFQRFLLNFILRECKQWKAKPEGLVWNASSTTDPSLSLLPSMTTDISAWRPGEYRIIDAKFYSDTFSRHFGVAKFDSGNLYQLLAYLMNAPPKSGLLPDGMLIFPRVTKTVREEYNIFGRKFSICTVDLSAPWQSIDQEIRELFH
jgi:hypothetical protein